MPFLRFSRDKRGYENTHLLHTFRQDGRSRPRVLYWFRTPPHVLVGRLPLDEEAIRAIEDSNPDLTFDWTKMLKMRPTPAAKKLQEDKGSTKRADGYKKARTAQPTATKELMKTPAATVGALEGAVSVDGEAVEPLGTPTPGTPGGETVGGERRHPVVGLVGDDGLARLRARYAEIQARISEKLTDPVALEAMRVRAEALNPDGWVNAEQTVHGIEGFDADIEAMKKVLGRRRRRSRRGGRRHRRSRMDKTSEVDSSSRAPADDVKKQES